MPGLQARPDEPAVQLAPRLAGTPQTTLVAFGTEAGLFQRAGRSTVVCGPGSIAQAHQADECAACSSWRLRRPFCMAWQAPPMWPEREFSGSGVKGRKGCYLHRTSSRQSAAGHAKA